MSKIQETAPDTIYLNIGGDTDDDLDFDLDAEVTWCHEPVFDNDIKYIKQPKLSIPKKIADALDTGDLMILAWTHANDLLGKVPDEERKTEIIRRNALARAYHAGKALGVELVEVSDE